MRIDIFQHVPFEGPAIVGEWAADRGHELAITRLDLGEALPPAADIKLLVMLGGPMGVRDTAEHGWLEAEKALLREVIAGGQAGVLGICLGAQLLAEALGGQVFPNAEQEIGWFPCWPEAGAEESTLWPGDLGETFAAFHWHGETFTLPPGALHLAASQATNNQAFEIDGRYIGLQFHWDYTAESIEAMLTHCSDELEGGDFVQAPADMRDSGGRLAQTRGNLFAVLDAMEAAIP